MNNTRLLALSAILSGVWVFSGAIAPEASASPCEYRSSAHVAEHGGIHEDSRWHVLNGELPTCGQPEERHEPASAEQRDEPDEPKSRYCRKHWYC